MDVDEEERFSRWLLRLQESIEVRTKHFVCMLCIQYSCIQCNIKELSTFDNVGLTESDQRLPESIRQIILQEGVEYPKWIHSLEKLKLRKFSSSSSDARTHLRHLAMPHALQGYKTVKHEIERSYSITQSSASSADSDANNNGDLKVVNTGSVSTKGEVISVPMHFNAVSSSSSDKTALVNFFKEIVAGNGGA